MGIPLKGQDRLAEALGAPRQSERKIDRRITLLLPVLTIGFGVLITSINGSILFAGLGVDAMAI